MRNGTQIRKEKDFPFDNVHNLVDVKKHIDEILWLQTWGWHLILGIIAFFLFLALTGPTYALPDLAPVGLQISNNTPLLNELVTAKATIINRGDENAASFRNCIYFNGVMVNCNYAPLSVGSTMEFETSFLVDVAGILDVNVVADVMGDVNESDENNNMMHDFISTSQLADLYMHPTYIILPSLITERLPFMGIVQVRNLGGVDINEALIYIYHTQETPEYLIATSQIYVPSGEISETSFTYTPQNDGYDVIIVRVDPKNSISESNENNNYAEKGFSIASQPDVNAATAYTMFFDIREKCMASVSNDDILMSGGLAIDENGEISMYLKLTDGEGKALIDGNYSTANEIVLPGRTLRILSIDKYVAHLLLVYQQPQTLIFNTCELDIKQYIDDLEYCENERKHLQSQLGECNAKVGEEVALKESLGTCNSDLQSARAANDSISAQVATSALDCLQKIEMQKLIDGNYCDIQMGAKNAVILNKEGEIDSQKEVVANWKFVAMMMGLFFALMAVAVAIGNWIRVLRNKRVI